MKIAIKLFLVVALVVGITVLASEIDRSLTVYPTPETQSTFLKSYSSAPVVERLKAKQSSSSQNSRDSSAGRKFATHHAEEEQYFVMASELKSPLIAAMRDDICHKLVEHGARIIGKTDSPAGFEVRYDLGKSRGIVALDPLQYVDPKILMGSVPVPVTNEALVLRVRIAETWSKAPPESRTDLPTLRNLTNFAQAR
jgi:hypothetical protein